MTGISEIMATMDYGSARESLAEGAAWIEKHPVARHFIGGVFVDGGDLRPVLNPAKAEQIASVPLARQAEISTALAAARRAQPLWEALGSEGRATHLYALARGLQKRERLIAEVEALNLGRAVRDLREGDIPLAAREFYHYAGHAMQRDKLRPDLVPYGLCAAILPSQAPLLSAVRRIAPALAAGNVIVLKPSDLTPLSAVLLAELAQESGLPPGVLSLLQGDEVTGAELVAHPDVPMIAFTGSAATGTAIRAASAGSGKALRLSVKGEVTVIVLEDADPDAAVEGVVEGLALTKAGSTFSGGRLLVQEGIAADFTARLKARLARLEAGAPSAGGIALGGHAIPPCDLTAQDLNGPLVALTSFRTADEAVQLAGHSRFPQAASIWSENITRATDLALRVRAGVVWINCINQSDAGASGGIGFDPEGDRPGIEAYLQPAAPAPDLRDEQSPLWSPLPAASARSEGLDITLMHWIGGKFSRADNGLSVSVGGAIPVASGSRKDIRNAVEAAVKATAWSAMSGHQRAQVLWFLAENLQQRRAEFAELTSDREVREAISCLLTAASSADKAAGAVRDTKPGFLTLECREPQGVLAILCPPEGALLGLVSLLAPALAMGNRVVCVPSETAPHVGAKLAQVLAVSDLPAGAVNIVTGPQLPLAEVLAGHEEVAAVWYFGTATGSAGVEALAAQTLKPVLSDGGNRALMPQSADLMRRAVRTRTIWLPFGA